MAASIPIGRTSKVFNAASFRTTVEWTMLSISFRPTRA